MADRLVYFLYERIVQCVLVVDDCGLTRLCDEAVRILLESHAGSLHVPQDGCDIVGNRLNDCILFEDVAHLF